MVDEQGPPGAQRRRPTIDLEATEVGSGQAASAEGARADADASAAPRQSWRARVGAGLIGAALTAAALIVVFGLFAGGDHGVGRIEARLAEVEARLRDLATRPLPNSADPKAVDELGGRVQKLEAALADTRAPAADRALTDRLAAIEAQLQSLSDKLADLGRRSDDNATAAREARQRAEASAAALAQITQSIPPASERGRVDDALAQLAQRVGALESGAKTVQSEVTRAAANSDDRRARLAVAASALAAAVERGGPFAAELGAAKSLAPDPGKLAPLDAFAAAGLPTAASLARELSDLVPALLRAGGAGPNDGGFLTRLRANAEKLVRIRPLEEAPGDDPAAVIARIEVKASRADIAGALAEFAQLPADARAPAQAWIGRAQARAAAIEASRRFAADALAALPSP
jgi:hypothetical protein